MATQEAMRYRRSRERGKAECARTSRMTRSVRKWPLEMLQCLGDGRPIRARFCVGIGGALVNLCSDDHLHVPGSRRFASAVHPGGAHSRTVARA
jgi:hypothetical protein